MKQLLIVLMLALPALNFGCATKVPVHPGAVSNIDSYAYDLLLVEQEAINSARTAFLAGQLPPNAKAPLNAAIAQYNITLGAWQGYHSGATKDSTVLQGAVDALVGAVGALQTSLGKTLPTSTVPTAHVPVSLKEVA
jgi:hypothetical protein